MTTYTKAWLFNGIWTAVFLLFLSSFLTKIELTLVAGVLGYVGMAFLGQYFPKCTRCDEPVNMPHERHGWVGLSYGFAILPSRPKRECGYCGHDLTANSAD